MSGYRELREVAGELRAAVERSPAFPVRSCYCMMRLGAGWKTVRPLLWIALLLSVS